MNLSERIRKYAGGRIAAATPATFAKDVDEERPPAAMVASVAVANLLVDRAAYLTTAPIRSNGSNRSRSEAQDAKNMHPLDPDTDETFTPYCVPMPADHVTAMLAEIRKAVDTLAHAEGWPDARRAHLLDILRRQPAYTLADDLAHFRQRLEVLRSANRAAEIPVHTCGSCQHMTHHESGVPVRCQMGKALRWRHHEWLDAPGEPNGCGLYERRQE